MITNSRAKFILLIIFLLCLFSLVSCNASEPSNQIEKTDQVIQRATQRTADSTQAYLMLEYLDAVSKNEYKPELLESIMNAEGTDLIVAQMNLARKTSKDQYRQILIGLANGELPNIAPVDSTERAQKGVDGLRGNVWPILNWGLDKIDILRQRIEHLDQLDFYEQAYEQAMRFLPEPVDISPEVHIVMGGRAGGAKLSGQRIYIDVLVFSFRDRRENSFPSDEELINTIAHEMHHMAYEKLMDQKSSSLNLDDQQQMIFDFLSGILSEGSATYLISEARNIENLRNKRGYSNYFENEDELLAASENIIRSLLEGKIDTKEKYSRATAEFLGNWYHSTGSLILSVIDKAEGLDGIMEVVADPRKLLVIYNRSAKSLFPKQQCYIFNEKIAESILSIGE